MKFHIKNDLVTQISYFKTWPDTVSLGGIGGGGLKSWKVLKVEISR